MLIEEKFSAFVATWSGSYSESHSLRVEGFKLGWLHEFIYIYL